MLRYPTYNDQGTSTLQTDKRSGGESNERITVAIPHDALYIVHRAVKMASTIPNKAHRGKAHPWRVLYYDRMSPNVQKLISCDKPVIRNYSLGHPKWGTPNRQKYCLGEKRPFNRKKSKFCYETIYVCDSRTLH